MNAEVLAHIERILAEAHEAAAQLMWTNHDKAKSHLQKAALAVTAATKALEGRRHERNDS